MKLRGAWCALLLVLHPAARADFQSLASPGPLAESHKAFENSCEKCHVPFKGIPASACLACHETTQLRIASGIGTHAKWQKEGKKCSSCHEDHKGRKAAITPPVVERGFDHAVQSGVVLEGKHRTLACTRCHKPGARGPKWVGLASMKTCLGCHVDPHKGSLGVSCVSCHTAVGWKPAQKRLADHKVAMTGGHQGLSCNQCHANGAHLVPTSSCGDCHAQKHSLPVQHESASTTTGAACATCHNTNDWKSATFAHDFCTCRLPGKHQTAPCLSCHPAFKFSPTPFACASCHKKDLQHEDLGACAQCHSALSWKTKVFDHNRPRVGFGLTGKHLEIGCENCHTKKGVFKGAPTTCEGCHKVPAHGDFGACARCHTTRGFDKPTFSHERTNFPLDGQHAGVSCQQCHAKFVKGSFVKGPNACALCHADPHKGQFGLREGTGVMLASNGSLAAPHTFSAKFGCLDCHTTRAWKPSTIDVPRHASFGFALKGTHQGVACARCHDAGVFKGTGTTCASCHLDRHRGRFGGACQSCHDESSWKHHPSFDHGVATGFQLTQAHEGLACAQCHGNDRQKLAALAKVTCATCHQPAHGDQFGGDCQSCHKLTKFSDVPTFDHRRTLFPLDRRHAAVRCSSCHDAKRTARLDPNCRSCHGDPHRGRALLDCGDCHRADRWSLVRFDHDRSEFPLRGRHFTTPCRDCHTNDQFTGVRAECVSCHRGDRVRADSLHLDHRAFGFDCGDCHRPFNW